MIISKRPTNHKNGMKNAVLDPSQWDEMCFEYKKSNFNEKMEHNFQICFRSGPRRLTVKYPFFDAFLQSDNEMWMFLGENMKRWYVEDQIAARGHYNRCPTCSRRSQGCGPGVRSVIYALFDSTQPSTTRLNWPIQLNSIPNQPNTDQFNWPIQFNWTQT